VGEEDMPAEALSICLLGDSIILLRHVRNNLRRQNVRRAGRKSGAMRACGVLLPSLHHHPRSGRGASLPVPGRNCWLGV